MKTILRNSFLLISFAVCANASPSLNAKTGPSAVWEVAVIILGKGEPKDIQGDIDRNIMEMAETCLACDKASHPVKQNYNISIARDFDQSTTFYFNKRDVLDQTPSWDPLFFSTQLKGVKIPGQTELHALSGKSILDDQDLLKGFLSRAYSIAGAHRILVVYGHGVASQGLQKKSLLPLEKILSRSIPSRSERSQKPLDVFWLNSCFMGSIEVVAQFSRLADFIASSEEAEFSTGMPFDSLTLLEDTAAQTSVSDTVQSLALKYLESYSQIDLGSQRHAVEVSPATISVVETSRLQSLLPMISNFWKKTKSLTSEQSSEVIQGSSLTLSDVADLGQLVLQTRRWLGNDASLLELLKALQLEQRAKLHSNQRLYLKSPREIPDSQLVVGYNNWSRGDKDDSTLGPVLSELFGSENYVEGPDLKLWPVKKVSGRFLEVLFAPGVSEVNYYWADGNGEPTMEPKSLTRGSDVFFRQATRPTNPVIFFGATQGAGDIAERLTGLNIAVPFQGPPTVDYIDSEFFNQTQWSN